MWASGALKSLGYSLQAPAKEKEGTAPRHGVRYVVIGNAPAKFSIRDLVAVTWTSPRRENVERLSGSR